MKRLPIGLFAALLACVSGPAGSAALTAQMDDAELAAATQILAQLKNPAERQQLLLTRRALLTRLMGDQLKYAGLQEPQIAALLDILTSGSLRSSELQLDCRIRNSCDTEVAMAELATELDQAIKLAVGPDGMLRFMAFGQLRAIKYFRNRMPERLRFSDAVAEQLALLITEEKSRILPPDVTISYGQRVRERAATLLSAEQMARMVDDHWSAFAQP